MARTCAVHPVEKDSVGAVWGAPQPAALAPHQPTTHTQVTLHTRQQPMRAADLFQGGGDLLHIQRHKLVNAALLVPHGPVLHKWLDALLGSLQPLSTLLLPLCCRGRYSEARPLLHRRRCCRAAGRLRYSLSRRLRLLLPLLRCFLLRGLLILDRKSVV